MPRDFFVRINGKKYYSIEVKRKKEAKINVGGENVSSTELTLAVQQYKKSKPAAEQTIVYPNINAETIESIMQIFPELNPEIETALVFYKDFPYRDRDNWLMISDSRIYFKLFCYPYSFDAIDCIFFNEINDIEIKYCIWPNLDYINFDGKRIGTLMLKAKYEAEYLQGLIKLIHTSILQGQDKQIKHYNDENKREGYEELENGFLIEIASNYFKKHNLGRRIWGFNDFQYGPFINEYNLSAAQKEYANYDNKTGKPILLVDDSFLGRLGTIPISGILVTNKYLYNELQTSFFSKFNTNKIPIKDIKIFNIRCSFKGKLIINNKYKFSLNKFDYLGKRDA